MSVPCASKPCVSVYLHSWFEGWGWVLGFYGSGRSTTYVSPDLNVVTLTFQVLSSPNGRALLRRRVEMKAVNIISFHLPT